MIDELMGVYNVTTDGDLLRKLFVDITARSYSFGGFEADGFDFTQRFLY